MSVTKLTDPFVKKCNLPAKGRTEVFDKLVTGLCFRVTDKGAKSWSLVYRFNGELRRDTLGKYPDLSLSQARQKARDTLSLVGDRKDPRAAVAAAEAAEAERKRALQENTVAAVAEEFIRRKPPSRRKGARRNTGQRHWPRLAHIIREEIAKPWGDRPIAEIRKRDVIRLIDAIVDRGAPVQANRVLTIVKWFFHWAASRDLIDTDPAAPVETPTVEARRTRTLKDHEILAAWKAAEKIGWPYGQIVQLLLLTGQRRGEIGGLRWAEVDRDKQIIEIPASRYKTGIDHVVPLSDQALAIIDALPRIGDSPFVFTITGKAPVVGHDKAKTRIDALMPAGTEPWVVHDLRRTVRTKMSEIGIKGEIAERVLGHLPDAIRQTYDRHDYLKEKRQALTRWAAELDRIINPPAQGEKVVKLTRN